MAADRAPAPTPGGGGLWLTLADGGQTVWVSLDHVRQVLFCDSDAGRPSALLWCADDLWEIADPAGLAALRRYLAARALQPTECEHLQASPFAFD